MVDVLNLKYQSILQCFFWYEREILKRIQGGRQCWATVNGILLINDVKHKSSLTLKKAWGCIRMKIRLSSKNLG